MRRVSIETFLPVRRRGDSLGRRAPFTPALVTLAATALLGGCAAASSSEAHMASAARDPNGDWFVQTGCTACHSISVYGLGSAIATGPDLSAAVEDVPRRFNRSLEDFLYAPTGTMAMVLAGRIPLNDEERALAAVKLREAYRRHQELSGAGTPAASH